MKLALEGVVYLMLERLAWKQKAFVCGRGERALSLIGLQTKKLDQTSSIDEALK